MDIFPRLFDKHLEKSGPERRPCHHWVKAYVTLTKLCYTTIIDMSVKPKGLAFRLSWNPITSELRVII